MFVVSFLLIITVALTISVFLATKNHISDQLKRELLVGESVINQRLKTRQQDLFKTASLLTADFGFKQAVATRDKATASSVLNNHGRRINADIMALAHLNGEVYASNFDWDSSSYDLKTLFNKSTESGHVVQFFTVGKDVYQIVLLPVKAPIPIAYTLIGFKVDNELLASLKNLVILDVTFKTNINSNNPTIISTLDSSQLNPGLQTIWDKDKQLQLPLLSRPEYMASTFAIDQLDGGTTNVFLTASVRQIYSTFDSLQGEIFGIALVVILFALIRSAFTSRNLVRPLVELTEFTQKIANGEFRAPIPKRQNIKEVQVLANSFERMQIDLAEREARIVYQAHHDPLTQLINRQHITSLLKEILTNNEQSMAVICINILNFRLVNDTFGHYVGDQCLKQIGARLNTLPFDEFHSARLGGDEFLVACRLNKSVERTTSDLHLRLIEPYTINEMEIVLSFCMGVAIAPKDGVDANELVQRANIALDMVRREQLTMAFYQPKMEEAHVQQLQLLADLKATLNQEDNDLQIYFQPKISCHDPLNIRFEALIRWIHPERGFVPPDLFIPLAEQAGLISTITDWVINATVKQIALWRSQGLETQVAINLSAKDLSRKFLQDIISDALQAHDLPNHCLAFEITESEIMRDPEEAIELLTGFRNQGLELAIDDFGTGYSSLSQLKNMPVTDLKIDKSFILQLASRKDDQIIVKSTIALAHSFNLHVVAEGIEDAKSMEMLKSWGCDWFQGFFISKPLPAKDVLNWIDKYQADINSTTSNLDYNV